MNSALRENVWSKLRSLVASFLLCCSLLPGAAFAQSSGSGVLTGRVTNQGTRDPLWQASVQVKGTSISTITERDGEYRLAVPVGNQVLVVSYTGLDTQELPVTVAADHSTTQDIALTSEIYKLDALTVSGFREGQSLAIQQQRQAPNVKVVTAIDAFGNPAANPGELIQRLADVSTEIVGSEVRGIFIRGMDPSFSVLQVDGNQMASSRGTGGSREFQIEQMGTGNIAAIEVIKAPRPEDDANSIAGYVNLITKRAYDSPGRQIKMTVGTMWRDRDSGQSPAQDKPGLDQLSLSYSDIFSVAGGEKNLGIALNLARRISYTTQDEVGAGLLSTGPGALWFRDGATSTPLMRVFGTGDLFYKATAENYGLSVDYKLGPQSYAYLKLAYNTNDQDQLFYRWDIWNPTNATYDSANPAAGGFTADSTADYSVVMPKAGTGTGNSRAATYSSLFYKLSKNYSINPGVSLKLFDETATLDVSGFYSYANIKYPDYNTVTSETTAVAPGGLGWSLDFRGRDMQYPLFTQTSGASVYDAASYTPTRQQKIIWEAPVTIKNGKIDFKKDFDSTMPASLKAGVKRFVQTQEPSREWEYQSWTGGTGISPYVSAQYRQGNGRYGPFPFILPPGLDNSGRDILASGKFTITDRDAYDNYGLSRAGDGKFTETITAAYVQGTIKIGDLTVLAGVRVEQTKNEVTGYIQDNNSIYNFDASLNRAQNVARAAARYGNFITTEGDYTKVHPGLHLTYSAPYDIVLRASYNNSITRPNIPSLLATTVVNPLSSPPTISSGNPNLKPYTSDNFEVSVEKYFVGIGKISVGGFYKDISDYFTTFTTIVPSGADNGFGGDFAGYNWTRSENTGEATIKGFNVDYAQQFTFLPGFLKHFGVSANYTRLKAEGNFSPNATGTAYSTTLNGLVPESANVGLSYVDSRFQLRLLAGYRGEFVLSQPAVIGASVPNASNIQYRDERTLWDFKSLYRINDRFDIYLDVFNLTNEATSTVKVAGRETFTLWQGTSYSAGVNVRF